MTDFIDDMIKYDEQEGAGMIIKDANGTRITIQQAKNGKIIIPIGNTHITLDKSDAERFTLYDIEEFDIDLYRKAYQ